MTRLRRCPACRIAGRPGRSVIMDVGNSPHHWYAVCIIDACGMKGPFGTTKREAAAAWNALSRAVKRGMKRDDAGEPPVKPCPACADWTFTRVAGMRPGGTASASCAKCGRVMTANEQEDRHA